ncbi:Hypothetical protein A7982_05532 [Minicystis rosea]|nr:Hypothetical protein A7982_05532 [Minicystis rosea]
MALQRLDGKSGYARGWFTEKALADTAHEMVSFPGLSFPRSDPMDSPMMSPSGGSYDSRHLQRVLSWRRTGDRAPRGVSLPA